MSAGPAPGLPSVSTPAWNIVITEWALDSYLNLKQAQVFTVAEYRGIIRPDVQLLRDGIPSPHPKFAASSFWGPAKLGNVTLSNGYKMKWRQLGSGHVQLRLPVTAGRHGGLPSVFLCESYEKRNASYENRKLAKFKTHMNLIALDKYIYRGSL
jgi:hypothetical protein